MAEESFNSRPEKDTLRLFLVRHGETEANRMRRLQGASDGLMNITGMKQVETLANHLRKVALDKIISSDLQRAVLTARAIANIHGIQIEIESQLREWNVGELDGQPAAVYLQMIHDSGKPISEFNPTGGERLSDVRERSSRFTKRLITGHIGEAVLVCSHGDFLRMMVSCILDIDIDTASAFRFDNASYSVFEFTENRWKVLAINRIASGKD